MESLKFEDLTLVVGYFMDKLGSYQRVSEIKKEHLVIEMQSFTTTDAEFLIEKNYHFTIFNNRIGKEKNWIRVIISKN